MRWPLQASGDLFILAKRSRRTAKSCGPGAATLASIRPACAETATVTIKAAHRGEHGVSRKAIARGRPGCPGCTCGLTRVHSFTTRRTRDCGRSRRPAFPAPSLRRWANEYANLRRNRAVRTRAHVFPRHCKCSDPSTLAAQAPQGGSPPKRLVAFAPRNNGWATSAPRSASPCTASTR